MNQEIYSLHDCRRGVLQKNLFPFNTLEEQRRRNMSNSLKSRQGFTARCLSQRGLRDKKLERHPGKQRHSFRSWIARRSELSKRGSPGPWPVGVVDSRALRYLSASCALPLSSLVLGFSPQGASGEEEGGRKSSCLHAG